MLALSPVTNPALGTITSSSAWAAVNYGHLEAPVPVAEGTAWVQPSQLPPQGSPGMAALGSGMGGAQQSQDGTCSPCSALAASFPCPEVRHRAQAVLQSHPRAHGSPAHGKG